jgi:hypothetical protein
MSVATMVAYITTVKVVSMIETRTQGGGSSVGPVVTEDY